MIHHPKHVILLELAKAGVPNDQLHTAAERIGEAYEEANPHRVWPEYRHHFELADPDVTERDEEGGTCPECGEPWNDHKPQQYADCMGATSDPPAPERKP